jgi:hypothetical protein
MHFYREFNEMRTDMIPVVPLREKINIAGLGYVRTPWNSKNFTIEKEM